MQRIDPHVTVRMPSPFWSQRVTPIRLIAIHATESPEESGSLDRDESYAVLSSGMLTSGKSPQGFNVGQLNADLASL